MWDKLLAALAALLKAMDPYVPVIAAYIAGKRAEKAKANAAELDALKHVGEGASDVRGMSDDDVVQYLKQRGMYHVLDLQAGDKQQ